MTAVVAGFRVQIGQLALTPLMLFDALLQPIVYGIVVTAQQHTPSTPTLVGVSFIALWAAVISGGAFAVVSDKMLRTLELSLATPTPVGHPLVGKVGAALLNGVVAVPVAWLAIGLLWSTPSADVTLVAVGLIVGALGFLAYGLLLAGLIARHRFFAGMLSGAYDAIAVLACFFVPASFLPAPFNWISAAFGPRWALEGLRTDETAEAWLNMAIGLGVSALSLVLALAYLARLDRTIRQDPGSMLL